MGIDAVSLAWSCTTMALLVLGGSGSHGRPMSVHRALWQDSRRMLCQEKALGQLKRGCYDRRRAMSGYVEERKEGKG